MADVKSHRVIIGITWMLAGMVLLPIMDGTAKYLSTRYPTIEVIWMRYFVHLCLLLPIVLRRYGPRALWPPQVHIQLVRGVLMMLSTVFFVNAVRSMPLADALAIVFIAPLIVTALSPWLLKEHVGVRRWAAVLTGFAGACLIIRPGFDAVQWPALLALGAGTSYALYLVVTRKVAGTAPPLISLFFTAVVAGIVLGLAIPAVWQTPSLKDGALMGLMGCISAGCHFLIIKAFDHAPVSVLAPLVYVQIVVASLFGYWVFGDFPEAMTWVGIAVIILSGFYITVRERKAGGDS